MWERLFHKIWRSRAKFNIPEIQVGANVKKTLNAFHGEYQVVVTVGGVKVREERVTVRKNQGPTNLNLNI